MRNSTKHVFLVLWICGWVCVALAAFVVAISMAQAQTHDHSKMGVEGKFYAQWNQMPERERSCCDLKDCYFTIFKTEGGTVFALRRRLTSALFEDVVRESVEAALEHPDWVVIPKEKLEENARDPLDSPDGESHVCMNEYGTVYCAVRGGGQ